jgi:hypothetical protein
MISFNSTATFDAKKIQDAADRASRRNLRKAGFDISRTAKQSIQTSDQPSPPGSPPSTAGKSGQNLRGAIYVDAQDESVVIGPRYSFVGESGEIHEFGKDKFGETFDERPFMAPALQKNLSGFAEDWRGTIGE